MRLHVQELGMGSPVIVLHGLFGSGDNWRPLAKQLSEYNRVVLIDLRNHGESPHDPNMSMAAMARDVEETVESLGLGQVGILGHSLGGKVAMECALKSPSSYSGVVVVDIAPKTYAVRHTEILKGMRAVADAAADSRREADEVLSNYVKEKRVRAFLLKSYDTSSQGRGWLINVEAIGQEYDHIRGGLSEELRTSQYTGPALFIRGELSDYLQAEDEQNILQLFPRAKFETIPRAGHWVHAEQPESFFQLIDGFRHAWS